MRFARACFSILMIVALIACSAPVAQLPTAVPTFAVEPTSPPTSAVATTSPKPEAPLVNEASTGPQLIEVDPPMGQELALDGRFTLTFDEPMHRGTVERAIEIVPEVPLAFEWGDDATVTVGPEDAPFLPDTEYGITVHDSATSATGAPLQEPRQWSLYTTGVARVAQMTPDADSTDVSTDSTLRIAFDRPVVPLVGIEDQASLPSPIDISPAVEGQGSWVNTSIYEFQPRTGWQGGITYLVETVAKPGDPVVAELETVEWSFETALPRVIGVEPAAEEVQASPKSIVRISFNQPMGQDATGELLLVRDATSEESIPGTIAWEDETLVFTPEEPFERGETYEVVLDAGAPAASGQAFIKDMFSSRFRVAPPLALESSTPKNGARDVPYWDSVQLAFTAPIERESLVSALEIEPKSEFYVWTDGSGQVAYISAVLEPSTTFTLTVGKELEDRFGQEMGKDVSLKFTTAARQPKVWLLTPGPIGLYDAYGEPTIRASAVNVSTTSYQLFSLSDNDFVSLVRNGPWPEWDKHTPDKDDLVRSWTLKHEGKLNQVVGIKTRLAKDGELAPGYYLLTATMSGADKPERHLVVVSPFNLLLKTGGEKALVWVTDTKTGDPVRDVSLTIYDDQGTSIVTGETDDQGLASLDVGQRDPWTALTVLATKGDDVGVVLRHWSDGISPWVFDLPVEQYPQPYRVFSYSDRQIYRPGQTVYYKVFVRADDDGRYSLPQTGTPVKIEVRDSQGRRVLEDQRSLSENGSFDGAVQLSDDASLGYYWMTFQIDQQYADLSFLVAEYRKPEFQAEMTLDRSDYVQGDVIQAEVSTSYFFGGAVADGKVSWNAIKEPYTPAWEGLEEYTFGDVELTQWPYVREWGGPVADGTGETDGEGQFAIELPVDLSEDPGSRRIVLHASIVDANNQEVSVSSSAVLHKAFVYAGLSTDLYVGTVGEEMGVNVITVDTKGQALPRQEVQVAFLKHEWYSVKEEDQNGNTYWTNETRQTEVASATLESDSEGLAIAAFTPTEGGTYRVRTTVRDSEGNENHSSLYLWVSSRSFVNWGQTNDNLMQLVADKDAYEVGDVARVLVPTPFDVTSQALLTIERGGVLEHSLFELDGASPIVEIPIRSEYVPNVFVGITVVAGSQNLGAPAEFKIGYAQLPVSTKQRILNVTIEPSQSVYKPRDEAEFTITTTDANGDPVSAEVSLQLVDLAVETLVGGDPPSILNAFYRERGLGVSTAASLTVSVDRYNLQYAREGKGGGGGGEMSPAAREYFPDTAYWRATLITNDEGMATVSVALPDNLTTWRMRAQAMTVDSLVGSARKDVVTNLDLMVRPAFPRFLVIDDQPELSAVVHNSTAQALTVDVSLQASGVTIENATQAVQIAAGGKTTVVWPARVTGTEAAGFTVSAQGGGHRDAVELELPITKWISPEVVATSGQIDERVLEQVMVPASADDDWGALVVLLEPSLAAGMIEGLRYLKEYPYACAEQTISRFYPNVVSYRALQVLDVDRPELGAALSQQVGLALQRLYQTQNLDGGWGWWPNEKSDATLTAYAVTAMVAVREADFAVDETVLSLAVDFLGARLDQELVDSRDDRDERAAVLYALAVADQGDLGRTVALYEARDDMSLHAKAYLGMTLVLLDGAASARVQTLVNEFEDAAILSGAHAHWEESDATPWSMTTDTRTTAMVLDALVKMAPDSQTLSSAVRWLMTARSAGRWETTQENAWAIIALTDYMAMTGELQGDYDYAVSLNQASLDAGAVTPKTVGDVIVEQVAMRDLLRKEANALHISRGDGSGRLYYSAYLNYYLPVEQIHPLARGVYVQRSYTYLDATGAPSDEPLLNGLIEVKLTIIAPQDLYYLVIEDALPAGGEAIDPGLEISRRIDQSVGLAPVGEPAVEGPYWRQYWPTHTEYHDDRVTLFATRLRRGTYEYMYTMRCSAAGLYNVLPALAYEMYAPDVMGRSSGEQLLIER